MTSRGRKLWIERATRELKDALNFSKRVTGPPITLREARRRVKQMIKGDS